MKAQATKAMVEPFDMNPIIKLWMKITNNSLLCQRLNEYMKLAKITIVFLLCLHKIFYSRELPLSSSHY